MNDEEKNEQRTRSVEKEVEIDAPLESVWKALTEAEELMRWFPLEARVDPGVGGKVFMAWGPECAGEARIEMWEPNRRLRTVDLVNGVPVKTAVDYILESRGGKTVLRLVHSGFEDKEGWDDEFETMSSGWASFLRTLKHYLERHPGVPRRLAWLRRPVDVSQAESWKRLASPVENRRVGETYSLPLPDGTELKGRVEVIRAPIHFTATIENLDDSFLFIEIEPSRKGSRPAIWVSTYGMSDERFNKLQQSLDGLMGKSFGATA